MLTPLIASLVITLLKDNSYETAYFVLYVMAAAVTSLGAVLVVKIRTVP